MTEADRRRFVAGRALRGVEQLTPTERIDLYEGIALILQGDEAEDARLTAFTIREAEQQQLKFLGLFADPKPAPQPPPSTADGGDGDGTDGGKPPLPPHGPHGEIDPS